MKSGDKVECPKCKHKQKVFSKLGNITCSSCQRKFSNPYFVENQKEEDENGF